MILENELKEILDQESISSFGVIEKYENKSNLILESNNLEELIKFAKINNIKTIFYTYSYYEERMFIIDKAEVIRLDEDIYNQIKNGIKKHNEQVYKIDFTKPVSLDIFCVYEGTYISIYDCNLWAEDLNILSGKEKLKELLEGCKDLIEKKKIEKEKEAESLRAEFKHYIVNDNKFKLCTNKNLRREYMRTIFNDEKAKKYNKLFVKIGVSGNYTLDNGSLFNFIEMIWREQKNKL